MRKVLTAKSAKNYAMNAKISVLYGKNCKVKSTRLTTESTKIFTKLSKVFQSTAL